MNARKTKLFRKIFKNRWEYREFKKRYTKASVPKKTSVSYLAREIVLSGKNISLEL